MSSTELTTLVKALIEVRKSLRTAKKKSNNPFFNSKYADLVEVMDVAIEPCLKNGVLIMQVPEVLESGQFVLKTALVHADSGETIRGTYPIMPVKQDPQGVGSALTYARRYSLMAMLGMVSEGEDDDGAAASGTVSKSSTIVSQKDTTTVTPGVTQKGGALGPKSTGTPTRRVAKEEPTKSSGSLSLEAARMQIWDRLVQMKGGEQGAANDLARRTTFKTKEGKVIQGVKSAGKLSEKRVNWLLTQIGREYKEYLETAALINEHAGGNSEEEKQKDIPF